MASSHSLDQPPRFRIHTADVGVPHENFAADVITGLGGRKKSLPAKYFYDARGVRLYEQICNLPEYYLSRAEQEIFVTYVAEMYRRIGHLPLVELGAGSATKTRYLLDAYAGTGQPFVYCPVDVSLSMLQETAQGLVTAYPQITVEALHAAVAAWPEAMQTLPIEQKAVAFFGSGLGNFTREESADFFRRLAAIFGPDDVFLLGIDLKKSLQLLLPAYEDAQGVTAAFNLNLLRRINRELGGTFDLENFEHVVLYNDIHGRIEMHLRSRMPQEVTIERTEQVVTIAPGEMIHTENSYKYTVEEVQEMGAQAGLDLVRTWFDSRSYFLVSMFRPQ
jgi:dimethylhistidine N-methyltransferase